MDHDETLLMPVILSTWMPEKVGGKPGKSLIFAETQVSFNEKEISNLLNLIYKVIIA